MDKEKERKEQLEKEEKELKKQQTSKEVMDSIGQLYLDKVHDKEEEIAGRINKDADLNVFNTDNETFVIDNKTIRDIEHQYRDEMYSLVSTEFKALIKKSCKKCYGSGIDGFLSEPQQLIVPIICVCVERAHNKKHPDDKMDKIDLLHKILNKQSELSVENE